MKKVYVFIVLLILLLTGFYLFRRNIIKLFFAPTRSNIKKGVSLEISKKNKTVADVEVIAQNLQIPWEIVFLPSGDILVTERPGRLLKIGREKKLITEIEGVEHVGEGGLLGMALHPNFSETNWLYLYLTTKENGKLTNRVERYKFENDKLSEKEIVLDGIAGAQYHDGGRIEFGPDKLLYITTGDAGNERSAQDIKSLNGKILRIKDDGSIPDDNPFGNEVYSYGHRNPQGLAWDETGRLWITEHGPSGLQSGFDEINLVEKGGNYGWPEIKGGEKREGMILPVVHSGADDTWAPAGMEYLNNSLFFAGLRGEALYEAVIRPDNKLDLKKHFIEKYGRIRAVKLGPDEFLYITTSNRDGRGGVNSGDDKIIKINPDVFL